MTDTSGVEHVNVDERLQRFLPMRIVIRRIPNGWEKPKIEGLVERSFDLIWSPERVNIFWSGKAYSILGEHFLDGVRDAEANIDRTDATFEKFIYDPLSADCPVEIDWERWLTAKDKFDKRNAPFKQK